MSTIKWLKRLSIVFALIFFSLLFYSIDFDSDYSASGEYQESTLDSIQNEYETQKVCPPCSEPSDWSSCNGYKQNRVTYSCSELTNYECVPSTEERSCVPENESDSYIEREYSWSYKGVDYTWSPLFSKQTYDYYKDKPRPQTDDFSIYATDPYDDEWIKGIVKVFREDGIERDLTEREIIDNVVAFVQSLPYTSDSVTTGFDEYPRYPLETLVDGGGDCEDTSILTATLLTELGYGAVLIEVPGHMAVGVLCEGCTGVYYTDENRKYFYLETTGDGYEIGDIPNEYRGTSATFRYLISQPIISFDWENTDVTENSLYATYILNITVKNDGSAPAKNARVWVGFDTTESGKVWSQIQGEPHNIQPGDVLNSEITLSVKRDVYTRLRIVVYGDNFYSKESKTDWFEVS